MKYIQLLNIKIKHLIIMSKIMSNLIIFLVLFYFISSQEEKTNTTNNTENVEEDINFKYDSDPFKDFDFGNLIWLDDSNATTEINKYDLIYVLFYAPWCEPCFNFFPTYVNTSKYAEEKKLNIKFAKIDGTNSTNTSEIFQIQQFPSLFLIYKGKRFFFEGKRTQEGILKFVDRKINNDTISLDSLSQIKEYINSSFLTLLSTIKDKENKLHKAFIELSKNRMNIDFITCISDECIKEYGENIVLYKEFDEKINLFTKEMGPINKADGDSLNEFIAIYSIEAGGMLTSNEINMMFDYKRNMIMYFRNSFDENQTKYDNIIKELGFDLRKKNIYVVRSDILGDPIQEHIARSFMMLPIDLPAFLLYDQNINAKENDLASLYILRNMKEEQFNKEYLLKYVDDIIAGKVPKTLYSEPPLDNYYIEGIKIIIGRTFDSDVIDNKNNVLLALINSRGVNIGTNRVLAIMKNLSKKYDEEEDKILFAACDAQKNEPRDVVIAGHVPPIVLLYTNAMKEKKKIEFKHDNFTLVTEEEIENFLMENLGWTKKKEYKEPETTKEKKEEVKKEENKEEKKEEKKEEDKAINDKDKKEDNDKIQSDL